MNFKKVQQRAAKRKGGQAGLDALMPKMPSKQKLAKRGDDRYLAAMTKVINQAGFNWTVIENKWPEFEDAFYRFDIDHLVTLNDEQWEAYLSDRRVVRNGQKVMAVRKNAQMIKNIENEYGGFGKFLNQYPSTDQIGLMTYLKDNGSRLGGMSSQWFLRRMGWDAFVLSGDVVSSLQEQGLEIKDKPSSKKEMRLIQDHFNAIQDETNLPMTHISKIMSYSIGDNYDAAFIQKQMGSYDLQL